MKYFVKPSSVSAPKAQVPSSTRHTSTGTIRQEPDATYLNSRTLRRYFESFVAGATVRCSRVCIRRWSSPTSASIYTATRSVRCGIDSKFRFEGGLIREHRDDCEFWKWFDQAVGPIGKGAHAFDFLEDKLEQLPGRSLPIDVEERVRASQEDRARKDRRLHDRCPERGRLKHLTLSTRRSQSTKGGITWISTRI
ncbi:hypothetical protein LuPra_04087 [Luteitalea pratensis]|uniref:Uncharacterized protein n=1 Tax=Luteitalea pratensis TaxID=1855912 RepID=A0A143PSQ4_LUTPR|nr:hypothetical protein [Luteitalea pratensis]AMY10844.1 hypothetical protein LuPra_04087 [Luteitalea pratensis]